MPRLLLSYINVKNFLLFAEIQGGVHDVLPESFHKEYESG